MLHGPAYKKGDQANHDDIGQQHFGYKLLQPVFARVGGIGYFYNNVASHGGYALGYQAQVAAFDFLVEKLWLLCEGYD